MVALVFVLTHSSSTYSYRVPGTVLGAENREKSSSSKLTVMHIISSNKMISSQKRVFSVAFYLPNSTVLCG